MKGMIGRLLGSVSIVHSVPGRMRLHVPFLAHVPKDARIAGYAKTAAEAIHGVRSVEIRLVTSSMVVHYDSAVRTEAELLRLAQDIADLAARHADRFLSLNPRRQQAVADRIHAYFQQIEITPGDEVRLPDDIWTE